ncbi:lysozyme inhibitor LprI family protein [Campylobacter jejuni]|uniref:lysozyme inhibitor LprI family protein n=1 Tax=Campylobacter jejuni TaxID=197 RepID=UPI003BA1ED49
MQKFLIVLGLCLMLSISANAQSPKEAKPSFDCAKAKSKVEKMICNDESGELQKLDRLYSKLYFSILKSIPKDTKEGQKTREKLKYFNHSVMSNRNIFQCYFVAPFETKKQEDRQSNYCIKQIYLEAIATLAFKMIDSGVNRERWGFNERVKDFVVPIENSNGTYDMNVGFLSNYNLFNNFFENTTQSIVIDFMAYNIMQWNYFLVDVRINEANADLFDEAVEKYKIYYEKLYQAFTKDKKLNKLLGN